MNESLLNVLGGTARASLLLSVLAALVAIALAACSKGGGSAPGY